MNEHERMLDDANGPRQADRFRSIEAIAADIKKWRKNHGFYTPHSLGSVYQRDMMIGKLGLVVSEVAEAMEAVRHENMPNFREEIADAVIRLFDIAATTCIDLKAEIEAKMEKNRARPHLHDKRCSL